MICSCRPHAWLTVLIALGPATAFCGADPIRYTVTDIGSSMVGVALDASGHVVGGVSELANTNLHAFFYNGKSIADLGTLGGDYSFAYGVNSKGQIVGESKNAAGQVNAFLYTQGKMSDLGTLGGNGSRA